SQGASHLQSDPRRLTVIGREEALARMGVTLACSRSERPVRRLSRGFGQLLLLHDGPAYWQPQQHHRAAPWCRADAHRALMKLGERFCDRQPQTRALMAFGELALDLLERPRKPRERIFGNADASIGD